MANVLVICNRRFNAHHLWVALGTMTKRGHTYDVMSTSYVIEDEETHRKVKIKKVVGDVDVSEIGPIYQGVMLISGFPPDTKAYWHNDTVRSYVKAADAQNLAIAAICVSLPTIRDAAKGKKVSFFPIIASRELLKQAGAILQYVALTRDQNLVTAEHEMASQVWVDEFCNLM